MRGQIRRRVLFLLPYMVSFVAVYFAAPEPYRMSAVVIWWCIGIPFVVAAQFRVWCPRCGTRLLHRYVKGVHSHSFFTQVRCHKCGLSAYQRAEFDPSLG